MSFWKKALNGFDNRMTAPPPEPKLPAPIRQRDCSEDPKPHFRFYPHAYEDGNFEESDAKCWLCGCPCGWRYVASIYSADKPEVVCARCLADGTLGSGTHDTVASSKVVDKELWFEAECCTPGISSFNPFSWPVVDGEPLAYLGHADQRDLEKRAEVKQAMAALAKEFDWPEVAPHYAMIFRSLDGKHWRASMDLD
ncbi:CbrC family protein [Aurantiacibacter sediminis]|uniref:CbrC family protein n=1 Tax=Aurantiacibacter sediminis TaxID=2793064 RepID=A0ABS0N345_9SPHN|nr:CbrC family protein [Aurantiacibacter sediminis]MBH5322367.1 CbrC family protein [Aurantiacibacter sediminis]